MKAEFFGKLRVEYINGNIWRLIQNTVNPFGVVLRNGDKEYIVQPHHNFYTDFLSAPRFARGLIPKVGDGDKSGRSGVIHDWLYSYPGINLTPCNRGFADSAFLACLKADKVWVVKRDVMYLSVRIRGHKYYGRADKLNKLRGIDG